MCDNPNGDVMYVSERENFFEGSLIYGADSRTWGEMAVPGTDQLLVKAALATLREARAMAIGDALA